MEEFNWLGREEFILFSKFWEWNTKNLVLVAFDICEFDRESDRAFVIEQTTLLLSGNWKKYWKFFFFFFLIFRFPRMMRIVTYNYFVEML